MKSSSKLFPVSLLRAETIGEDLVEDTYLLKPSANIDPSIAIALTRVGLYDSDYRGVPVILLHGSFSNRGFWLSPKGVGLADELVRAGFDPWLMEMRGHGDSPVNRHYKDNNVEHYASQDLPAVQKFVQEQTGLPAFWIGHSLGGVTIATALSGGHLNQADIAGTVLFGAQVSQFPILLRLPFLRLFARAALQFKSLIPAGNRGPENEPAGIAREFVRWAGWLHGWKPKGGQSYWNGLPEVKTPVLGFGAQNDKGDPARYCEKLINAFGGEKAFALLSKQNGFLKDYNHINMVVSKESQAEVWPRVISWLNEVSKKMKPIKGERNDSVCNT